MKTNSPFKMFILVLFGNILLINAQQDYSITDFDRLIDQNTTQNRAQDSFNSEEVDDLKNLVFELNPLLVINGNEHTSMGEGAAQLVIVQSSQLSQLASVREEDMQAVSLVLIKHSSTNTPAILDLNSIKTPSLRYVLIECDFECSVSKIQSMVINTSKVKVLYRITTEQ